VTDREFQDAVARHQAGDLAAAERLYRAVLTRRPADAPSLCNLGAVLARTGRPDDAADCYRRALAAHPGHPDAHFNLGNLHRRAGRLADADASYAACLAARPDHAAAAFNRGLVALAAGDLRAAADHFRTAAALDPNDAEASARLGDVLLRMGRPADALAAFRRAVELQPADPRGRYNLGLALSLVGRPEEALVELRQALAARPDYPEAHNAIGLVLDAAGHKDDARGHYREAVRLRPEFADAWSNLGTSLCEGGQPDDGLAALRKAVALNPGAAAVHSNLVLQTNYSSRLTPEEVFAEHRAWADRHAGPTPPRPPLPHHPDRRLRIGYLSADFRAHTVAGFLELLQRNHDRSRVEVYAYAQVPRPDAATERLRALADHWRPLAGLTDAEAADLIRSDAIDALIDLGGHTANNRLLVLARRPAPVQATLFGYPNTTGMAAVDYRITDAFADPLGQTEHLSTEALLRLSGMAWAYRPPADAPPVSERPAGSAFTFGCLNNAAKISEACLAAWAELLCEAHAARLVLLAGGGREAAARLAARFAAAGVSADRLDLLPRMPASDYFAAYGRIDVALDPFPYNGGVTTCDALWMGVPVLAVAGPTYVSRQGAGLMTRLGWPEFVAADAGELVASAKRWAADRSALAEVRAGLRERLAGSVICDGPGYVAGLEAELRRAVL
jgi:protein O-GlcNAc transferase